jgi:hypothetical protein
MWATCARFAASAIPARSAYRIPQLAGTVIPEEEAVQRSRMQAAALTRATAVMLR